MDIKPSVLEILKEMGIGSCDWCGDDFPTEDSIYIDQYDNTVCFGCCMGQCFARNSNAPNAV